MSTVETGAAVVLLAFGAGLVTAGQGIYRRWEIPGTAAFAAFVALLGVGGFGAGIAIPATDRILVTTVLHQFVELSAISWFVFTIQYTGRGYLLSRRVVAGSVVAYLSLWLLSLIPVFGLFPGVSLTTLIPVVRYLGGITLVLLGSTLLVQTTYQHGYLSVWGSVVLSFIAFDPWFLVLVGFGVDEMSTAGLYALYVSGFLIYTLLLLGVLFWFDVFTTSAATHTLGRRALVAETPDLIAVVDTDDRIVDTNDAVRQQLDADGDVYGETLTTLFGEDTETLRELESIEIQTTAGVRQFDTQVIPLATRSGDGLGHLVSLRDITERRQREQILDVLNRVLRHNLRNELSVVEGRTTIVRDRVQDPALVDHLDISQQSVDSLVELGNQAQLISSALEQNQELSTVYVTEYVDEVARGVREELGYGTVECNGEEVKLTTNRLLFRLALENVIENALEHSTAETPTATVTVMAENDGVRVRVDDNGPGIPQSETTVIQEGKETDTEHSSSIGLWIINWAITSCGGTVEFGDGERGGRVELWVPDNQGSLGEGTVQGTATTS